MKLRERQKAQFERAQRRALREAADATGYPQEKLIKLWENDGELVAGDRLRRLRESNAEFAFTQLLRSGVQQFLFDGYAQPAVIYPDLVRVVNSTKAEELFAPLYGAELPVRVGRSEPFPDSRIQGLDVRVQSEKWGRTLSFERELVDDDQTGQIQTRAATMGERMRLVEERETINAITGATYNSTIANDGTHGLLSRALIEKGIIGLDTMKDPLQNFIAVDPNTLLIAPGDRFNASVLINSTLQPNVPGAAGQTANTATSGLTGWTEAINPLQGLLAIKSSRYMPATGQDSTNPAWFICEAQKSLVFVDRDALELVQENPQSGAAFNTDSYRYRVRRRFAPAMIDSRWFWRGN